MKDHIRDNPPLPPAEFNARLNQTMEQHAVSQLPLGAQTYFEIVGPIPPAPAPSPAREQLWAAISKAFNDDTELDPTGDDVARIVMPFADELLARAHYMREAAELLARNVETLAAERDEWHRRCVNNTETVSRLGGQLDAATRPAAVSTKSTIAAPSGFVAVHSGHGPMKDYPVPDGVKLGDRVTGHADRVGDVTGTLVANKWINEKGYAAIHSPGYVVPFAVRPGTVRPGGES